MKSGFKNLHIGLPKKTFESRKVNKTEYSTELYFLIYNEIVRLNKWRVSLLWGNQ